MLASYRPRVEAPSQSQSIDRSEGTRSPSYAFVSNCRLTPYQSYMNVRVASIVFAQRTGVGHGSSLPIVSDTRPGRTQIFSMYALEGDGMSVDAPIVLKNSKKSRPSKQILGSINSSRSCR